MEIPSIIVAGDSVTWVDQPFADGQGNTVDSSYTLTYALRGPAGVTGLDVAGVAQSSAWKLTLSAAQTAALNSTAGSLTVYWHATATKSGARVTAGTGTVVVRPNVAGIAAATAFDGRSQAELDLAAIRAEISARISGGATIEYTIGTRSLKKEPMAALVELEQRCLRIVAREKRAAAAANGLGNPGRTGVRFG